jgi:hypothetical protein
MSEQFNDEAFVRFEHALLRMALQRVRPGDPEFDPQKLLQVARENAKKLADDWSAHSRDRTR